MAHAIKALLSHYDAAFTKKFGNRAPILAKDAALAKRLLGLYTLEQLQGWVDRFFEMDDRWIQQTGYSFGVFSASLGKVIVRSRPKTETPLTSEQVTHAQTIRTQQRAHFDASRQAREAEYYRTHPWAKQPEE